MSCMDSRELCNMPFGLGSLLDIEGALLSPNTV